MSRGKYYSLEEAREAGDLEGFAEDHPSTGNKTLFDATLKRMANNEPLEPDLDKWGKEKPPKAKKP